jgi:hypothetical protein
MLETRAWLLAQHGPICAYCGVKYTARVMTLDHVAPRRGQSAYDRRDNLVLACRACNVAKKDKAPLAFLLGSRARAANLVRYGAHLSQMLLHLAQSLVPGLNGNANSAGTSLPKQRNDEESPYRD